MHIGEQTNINKLFWMRIKAAGAAFESHFGGGANSFNIAKLHLVHMFGPGFRKPRNGQYVYNGAVWFAMP